MLLYLSRWAEIRKRESMARNTKSASNTATTKTELANRLFFRLYQCANMLHKTGTRAVEAEGLTTQQWAVLGALSRPVAKAGMSIGDLARYLMVSRQNLAGLIGRMERDGHVAIVPDARDRRSRLVTMTETGRHVWNDLAQPKIRAYYDQVLADFSINDTTHALHYLLKILDNMKRIDDGASDLDADEEPRD
ncbi:transcriptional regulator, MarR family [Rhodopseudomonas pseudopalustris]|uniref:Transcriptional regulator, MarR family n=2 Tax=Rhodopseudomonas TaxID=1073 RepID=A0A1H8UJX9_9BRAD|nr:transcriptional regulator, MarR family [Rhodopseudomonas pseudopalustris]